MYIYITKAIIHHLFWGFFPVLTSTEIFLDDVKYITCAPIGDVKYITILGDVHFTIANIWMQLMSK
jgi:hypothetical protein